MKPTTKTNAGRIHGRPGGRRGPRLRPFGREWPTAVSGCRVRETVVRAPTLLTFEPFRVVSSCARLRPRYPTAPWLGSLAAAAWRVAAAWAGVALPEATVVLADPMASCRFGLTVASLGSSEVTALLISLLSAGC